MDAQLLQCVFPRRGIMMYSSIEQQAIMMLSHLMDYSTCSTCIA